MNKTAKTPYLSFDTLARSYMADGVRPRIMVQAWYPIHDVEIIVRERAKERLTGIDLAVLGIIGEGITSVRDIISILGIQERFGRQILRTLTGDGQIEEPAAGHVGLSALGRHSLQEGAYIVETPRAFLLCGLSGAILHHSVNAIPRFSPSNISKRGHEWLLEPSYKVPNKLLNVDIGTIRSEKGRKELADLGIPDEAVNFGAVKSSKGCFIRAQVALGTHRNGSIGGSIRLTSKLTMPVSLVERDMKVELTVAASGRDELVAAARTGLTQMGIVPGLIRPDQDGVLVGQVDGADPATQYALAGRSWLYRLGTPKQPALPLWELWGQSRSQEYLKGNCLYLKTEAPELTKQAEAIRRAWSCMDDWYARPSAERQESLPQALAAAAAESGISNPDLAALAKRAGDRVLADRMEEN